MIKRFATGMFAFAAMFVMSEGAIAAADFDPKVSGVQGVTIQQKSSPDPEVHHVTRRPLTGTLGDSVFWIQKSKNSPEFLTTDGTKVFWGPEKTNWVFHKNSSGWSVMLATDEALAVSMNKNKDGLELQRNQGAPHQVWDIEKK